MGRSGAQGGRSLDASKIEAAYTGFHTDFHDALEKTAPVYVQLATVVETDNVVDTHLWLSNNPTMREWIGEKVLFKYRGESHPIRTKPHEASVEVPKFDVMNDRYGLYTGRIRSLAESYQDAIDDLFVDMIVAGIAGSSLGTTYDGQNLVDTDHTMLSIGGTAQSNKVTGAFDATAYRTAWQRYLAMVDEHGRPIRAKPRYLLHGYQLRDTVRTVLEQKIASNGSENIDAGTVIPVLSQRITGTEWALLPERSNAVIIHVKRGPEFYAVDNPEDSFVFRTGKFLYGIEAEFGAAYGMWQQIVGGPGA